MKRVNNKVAKRVVAIVLAAMAAFTVMGCSVEKNFTTTETHTYTDANGNTTTTTTTNHNGEVTTETVTDTIDEAMASADEEKMEVEEVSDVAVYEKVPVAFTNNMGWDIKEFYIKMSNQDEWSDNFLSEEQYIDDGVTVNGLTVNYSEEVNCMDIRVADSKGSVEEFNSVVLPEEGAEKLEIVFGYDEVNDVFTVTVNAE